MSLPFWVIFGLLGATLLVFWGQGMVRKLIWVYFAGILGPGYGKKTDLESLHIGYLLLFSD